MNKTASKTSRYTQNKEKSYMICVLYGTLWGIAAGVVLLLICGGAGLALDDPEKYTPILALSSLFISAFITGYAAAKSKGCDGAATGLGAGAALILLIVLLSLFAGEPLKLGLFAICAPVILVTSLFAGITGANRRSDAPKRKRKKIRF